MLRSIKFLIYKYHGENIIINKTNKCLAVLGTSKIKSQIKSTAMELLDNVKTWFEQIKVRLIIVLDFFYFDIINTHKEKVFVFEFKENLDIY